MVSEKIALALHSLNTDTTNLKILAIGQGVTMVSIGGVLAVHFLSATALTGSLGNLGWAFLLVMVGFVIPVGYYPLMLACSRKRPKLTFLVSIAQYLVVVLCLLVTTLAFSYTVMSSLNLSLGLEILFLPWVFGLGFFIMLAALAFVLYRTIAASGTSGSSPQGFKGLVL